MLARWLPATAFTIVLGAFTTSCIRTAESSSAPDVDAAQIGLMEKAEKPSFIQSLPAGFELPTDAAGQLLLREYGAVFVARNGAIPPKKVFFDDESDVQAFQRSVGLESERFDGINIELQKPAMRALESAVNDAAKVGLSISPRGSDSGRRGYNQTITLWRSRVDPGLDYWVSKGRLSSSQADSIQRLSIRKQISEILRLEEDGIYFAKSLDKSIIYSVAPPGSSQHIAMLAFDVKEFEDARVRAILGQHGWFQTVVSDLPHFTFIGVKEAELPGLGLRKVRSGNRDFWVPDLSAARPNMRAE